jgi:aspartyl-tRNA(Asn)/glutamyl-tRNA(Gln) amidotransferase subunit A
MEFNSIFAAPHPLLESSIKSDFDWESGPGLDTSSASDFSGKVDFILCPTAPTPPLRLECIENQTPVEAYINDVFTVPASMAGLPAISIPWGRNASAEAKAQDLEPGMNVGLQIIGQFGRDHQVIGFAKRLTGLRKMREEEQRST